MSAIMDTLTANGLKLRRDGGRLIVTPKAALTDELLAVVRDHKAELLDELDDALQDAQMEERRQNVLSQLRDNQNILRAVLIDERVDPEYVIVAVAIRQWSKVGGEDVPVCGVTTFEMRVPKSKADALTILGLVDKHSIRPARQVPVAHPGEPVPMNPRAA